MQCGPPSKVPSAVLATPPAAWLRAEAAALLLALVVAAGATLLAPRLRAPAAGTLLVRWLSWRACRCRRRRRRRCCCCCCASTRLAALLPLLHLRAGPRAPLPLSMLPGQPPAIRRPVAPCPLALPPPPCASVPSPSPHASHAPHPRLVPLRPTRPPPLLQPSGERLFTPQQLAPFDGRGGRRIYLAILGSVYDVTSGAKHYGGSWLLAAAGWNGLRQPWWLGSPVDAPGPAAAPEHLCTALGPAPSGVQASSPPRDARRWRPTAPQAPRAATDSSLGGTPRAPT